jgi:hypothetical protein
MQTWHGDRERTPSLPQTRVRHPTSHGCLVRAEAKPAVKRIPRPIAVSPAQAACRDSEFAGTATWVNPGNRTHAEPFWLDTPPS